MTTDKLQRWWGRARRWCLAGWTIPAWAMISLGANCDVETLFSGTFDADPLGGAPAATQSVGHTRVEKGDGTVTIVASPNGGAATDKWVRISHPTAPSNETSFLVDATHAGGNGTTSLLATMFIPNPGPRPHAGLARALATVQFETALAGGQSGAFMHLDFMDTGVIRIDDVESSSFGTFPFGAAFTLVVSSEVTASNATAHISLLSPATGQVDHPVSFTGVARAFNSVRFWIGYQWVSSFYVDDVSMLYSPPAPATP